MSSPTPVPPIPVPDLSPKARGWAYLAAWLSGTLGQGVALVWGIVAAASDEVSMPLWLAIAAPVLGFVSAQLFALAGRNIPSVQDVVDGDAPPPVTRLRRTGPRRVVR